MIAPRVSTQLRLAFGSVVVLLDTRAASLLGSLRQRYGDGVPDRDPTFVVRVTERVANDADASIDIEGTFEERVLKLRSSVLDGRFDLATGEGELAVTPHPRFGAGIYIEKALRELVQLLVLERGGFLLHAAGVVPRDDNRVWLFVGRSGQGKSTISRMLRRIGATVLSDDLILVDGATPPHAQSTPFFSALTPLPSDRRSSLRERIAGVYLIEPCESPWVNLETDASIAAAQIVSCVPFTSSFSPQLHLDLLEATTRVARVLPVAALGFRRDLSFLPHVGWPEIDLDFGEGC